MGWIIYYQKLWIILKENAHIENTVENGPEGSFNCWKKDNIIKLNIFDNKKVTDNIEKYLIEPIYIKLV